MIELRVLRGAGPVNCDRRIRDVVVSNRHETLLEQIPGMRIQHIIGDASLGSATDRNRRVKGTPKLPVGKIHLLHAGIVAGNVLLNVGERTAADEEITLAPRPEGGAYGAIGKTLSQGIVAGLLI